MCRCNELKIPDLLELIRKQNRAGEAKNVRCPECKIEIRVPKHQIRKILTDQYRMFLDV